MTVEGFKRKLTAILSADVAGYSRLMADDEASTVRTLADYREVINQLTKQHHGRVVDSPGDNILAEFASVVDAVQCAVAVQKELAVCNETIDKNRRMEFRIGINLGDVIDEDERIYGDGVNIAARLEALADPGGICVSKTAFDQIETKLPLGYDYLGEQKVKNIPKPIPAYRVLLNKEAVGKVTDRSRKKQLKWLWATALGLSALLIAGFITTFWYKSHAPPSQVPIKFPDKPSVAVLPFKNIGGGPEKDYIVDGITDKIINSLFQVPQLHVIARNSVYHYKDKAVDIRQASEMLRVRHIMEGSVQFSANRLRINAQLIDASTGEHLWAEGYDGDAKDLFVLQDDITKKVLMALQIKLTEGEIARVLAEGTDNTDAYLKFLRGARFLQNFTPESRSQATKLALEIIDLDPNFPSGYELLAWMHVFESKANPYDTELANKSLLQAEELAHKSLELNSFRSEPHLILAWIYKFQAKWDQALSAAEKAVTIDPFPELLYRYARILDQVGRHEDAIEVCKRAMKTDPIKNAMGRSVLSTAYFHAGQFEKARDECLANLEHIVKFEPEYITSGIHLLLAASYAELDQLQEAKKYIAEVQKSQPGWTFDVLYKRIQMKDKAEKDRLFSAYRKAGLQ
jgi:adenylate cyclase